MGLRSCSLRWSCNAYSSIPEREPAAVRAMGFSVASLLMKLRPGEKRQRVRWRPGWRYQKGPGRGFLFRLAKMGQDPIDDVLVLNTSDDFGRAAAAAGEVTGGHAP